MALQKPETPELVQLLPKSSRCAKELCQKPWPVVASLGSRENLQEMMDFTSSKVVFLFL